MAQVRSHTRRMRNGKSVRVSAHHRRGGPSIRFSGAHRRGITSLGRVTSKMKMNARNSQIGTASVDYSGMSVSDIAYEIEREWRGQKGGVNFAARPYLDAMKSLNDFKGSYYADSASSIGHYFLSNSAQFRGPKAKAIKAELRKRLKR